MPLFKGRAAHLGIALERDGKTASAAEYFVPRMESSFKDVIEQIQNESAFGNIAKYNDSVTTGVHGEGDISAKLWHKGLYYYLCLIFGQLPTRTVNEDGSYKYKFVMANNNEHMKATIFSLDPNLVCKYPSAMLSEASIEWSPTEFAQMAMNFISKRGVKVEAGSITPAYINDAEFKPHQLELKMAETVARLATAPIATQFRSASMTITKNVEGEQTSESGQDYGTLMNGELEASLSFEKLYTDLAYRDMVLNDSKVAVSFGFVDKENKAGTNTDTSLRFTFPKVMMTSYEPSMGLSDTASESFEGTAMLDLEEGTLVTAELVVKYDYNPDDES